MTNEQWQKVKAVFDDVAAYESAEWRARLDAACREDAEVRAEVEQLLGLQAEVSDFLEHPPIPALPATASRNEDQSGKQIGAYRLLREIGRGGMGTVYLAERADDVHRKKVAVKLVWPGFDSAEIFKRFRQERHILAELDHPNIARLLDGGTTDEGWSYVVMEYVDGEPLTQYCNQHKLSVTERLKLFQQVCAAVSYAHRNLVVHRDLKPSNILVTHSADGNAGTAKLLDFGIAKILDPALRPDSLSLTNTGLQAMTPEYASPEQVRAETITTATDVYSLGVLLYELLTGQSPYRFAKRTLPEVMRVIVEEEPVRPSQVRNQTVPRASASGIGSNDAPLADVRGTDTAPDTFVNALETTPDKLRRRLTGDLDNILLKALRKEPEHRYPSVEQFAEDITRHLSGQPVIAQAPTFTYRAGKFVRRNKTGVAFAAFVVLLLIASLIYAVRQTRQVREQARRQRRDSYATQLPRAAEDWERGNIQRMNETLAGFIPKQNEEELRGFEWYYLWRLSHRERLSLPCDQPLSQVFGNERRLVIHNDNDPRGQPTRTDRRCSLQFWDAQTGQLLRTRDLRYGSSCLNVDPDGDTESLWPAFAVSDYEVRFVDLQTGQIRSSLLNPARSRVRQYLDNYLTFVTGDDAGDVKIWEVATGKRLATLGSHPGPIQQVEGPLAGKTMIVKSGDANLTWWDWTSKSRLRAVREPEAISYMRTAYNQKWIWLILGERLVKLRDAATGKELAQLTTPARLLWTDTSPDSQRFFTASTDRTVKMYELPSLRYLATFEGHTDWVRVLRISPDGKLLVSAGQDHTVRLWDIATQRQLAVLRGHTGEQIGLNFSSNGQELFTVGDDRVAKVWNLAEVLRPEVIAAEQGKIYSVAFSPDGRSFATAGENHTVKLRDAQTGDLLKSFTGHTGQVFCVAFSPNGKRLVSSGENGEAKVWDALTGDLLFNLTGHAEQIHAITFSPDGERLATASDDRTVRLWDAATGALLRTLLGHDHDVWAVEFSPDGQKLASGDFYGIVHLWNVAFGELLAKFQAHDLAIWSLRFSSDGARLLSASQDRTAKLWNLKTAQPLVTFSGHSDEIFKAIFSPDQRRVVTAGNDNTVKIWDAATGQELLTLKDHTDQVRALAFAPDGQTLASAGEDGTVRLYRAATEQEVQAKLPLLNPAQK